MRVYVEAYGCAQNHGEASDLARALGNSGHELCSDPRGADVGVLVTCGVIGSTEERMVRRWEALTERLPRVVVTGCLVPLRMSRFNGPGRERTTFLRIAEQSRLPELLSGNESQPFPVVANGPALPPVLPVEEVVIAQGCTSHCSYCYSRLARGPLSSRPKASVLDRVRQALVRGAVEVRLSSLDTSCWGIDLGPGDRLPDLLQAVNALDGTFRIRVGMASPQSLRPISDRLFDAMSGDHVFRFLHLPFQSGSDRVLDGMQRGYTADEVRRLVFAARLRVPDLMLATDVIVGFPGESEADFEESLSLVRELDPEIVNVTRFSSRPSTRASRLPGLPSAVLKRRSRRLTELRLAVARRRMERWIGWQGPALTVEAGHDGSTVGRLPNYLPVVLSDVQPLGREVQVRVHGARSTYLLAEVVPEREWPLRVGA